MFKNKLLVIVASAILLLSFALSPVSAAYRPTSTAESTSKTVPITSVTVAEYEKNVAAFSKVSPNELFSKIKNKDTFFVYFGYSDCPYCRELSPTLSKLPKETNVSILYFDLNQEFDSAQITDIINFLQNDIKMEGTPTIALYQGGILMDTATGGDLTAKDILGMYK